MSLKDYIRKRPNKANTTSDHTGERTETKITIEIKEEEKVNKSKPGRLSEREINKEETGKLDMVIAFDTTGSMSAYIDDVRYQVRELIPSLFADNEQIRLGIVAFGDYCDMIDSQNFGDAYQCLPLTSNENSLIKFVKESKDTGGGDGPEFYELVLKKIIEESDWLEDAEKVILLIADAVPHELGYSFEDIVTNNQIDWRQEAAKAARMGIQIDTVSIREEPWFRILSEITNGVHSPFKSSGKTANLISASVHARGSESARAKFDKHYREFADDREMLDVLNSFKCKRCRD